MVLIDTDVINPGSGRMSVRSIACNALKMISHGVELPISEYMVLEGSQLSERKSPRNKMSTTLFL